MDRSALPRYALEDLAERPDESRVGVRDDEPHAHRPGRADSPQEGEPRVVRLCVDHVDTQDAPPAARIAADGGDHGCGGDAPLAAALDVGRVEPDVGHRRAVERPSAQILDVCVQARGDCAHLVLREPGDAHLLGHPLHLAGARARDVHLGDGGNEAALPVAVAAVRPVSAQLVGLGVHRCVHDLLGGSAKQRLHVDGAVVETGHGEHVRRRIK